MKEISDKLNQRLSSYYTLVQKVIDIIWDDNLGNSIVPPVEDQHAVSIYLIYLNKSNKANGT